MLAGCADPLELLFPKNGASAENLYDDAPFMKTANALVRQAVAGALKRLQAEKTARILEIGAGTGGTTAHVLTLLPADRTEYVFTDVSNSFLTAAARKFSSYPFVRYRRLDVEKEPGEQGFADDRFDIVIAANVLHATADLSRTFGYVKELLAPQGLLVLLEVTAPERWLDLIFGMVEGWWKFADKDLRPAHPLISQRQWTRLLEREGFEEAAAFPDESEAGLPDQAVITARGPRLGPERAAASEWLIFADQSGIAAKLVELIGARGEPYILISAGKSFARIDDRRFTINPENPDDFNDMLAAAYGRKCKAPRRVVYLWSLDVAPLEKTTAEKLEADQLWSCGGILHLAQALTKHDGDARLWLITRGAQAVRAQPEALAVTQSPVWGLGRVIALEHPEFWGGLIDLDENSGEGDQISLLRQEIGGDDPDAEDQIGFRGNRRYVPRLAPGISDGGETAARLPVSMTSMLFKPDSTYLITGGLGKLGLAVAQWMAEHGARHLTLISRRRLPARSAWDTLSPRSDAHETVSRIQAVERAGAAVRIVSGDVADFETMRALFAEFGNTLPALRGVIHAAGVVGFHPLADMDANVLRACLRPKIGGAATLHELTKNKSLDFFAAFSSGASVWSAKGLAHYAAANQFIDCLAHHRRAMDLPALTINWGWWAGGGTSAEWEKYFAQVGLEPMPAADALEILGRLLQSRAAQVTVAHCDWSVMRPIYEAKRRRRFLDRVAPAQTAVQNRPSETKESFLGRLRRTASSERREFFRDHVAEEVAEVLGVAHARALDPHQGFFRMGMDSLMTVQLRQRLENSLGGRPLPLTLAFEYPNIEALTRYLAGEVLDLDSAACRTSGPVNSADDAKPADRHDRLSENELVDLLAKKLEQLK